VIEMPKTQWAVTVDGAYIAYQDVGQGPQALVLIHGWWSHLELSWEDPSYVRFMDRLSRRLRVLVFDKRGTGMSDRFTEPPYLEARMDDVRAVMDAAGVERAALLGWGTGGPQLGCMFAATHPERTVALCIDPNVHEPWDGATEEELEREVEQMAATWGRDDVPLSGYDEAPTDPAYVRMAARAARFSATPGSIAALTRMWFHTDVRDVLPTIRVPTLVFHKDRGWSNPESAARAAALIPGARTAAVGGSEAVIFVEDPEPLVSAIEAFLGPIWDEEQDLDRVLATVLFTDIVDSTTQGAALGDRAWGKVRAEHDQIVRANLARYRGREIKTMGDGFLATFDGPARGVRCAEAIAAQVQPLGVEIRAGLHTGEVAFEGDDVAGLGVAICARIGAKAGASEVLVSQTVKDIVAGSGLTFEDAGEHELKGVPDRWRLYRATG
jgi:class 3 adenylate cyclase/pimeloyl-ACP methyl ester carboxylesterase